MRLAMHTDYALRILMYLTAHAERATVGDIAGFFGISKDHVAKVAQRLVRLGFVRGIRGIGGGLELAKESAAISVGEVVRNMEGNTQLLECVGAEVTVCAIQPGCKLRGVLAKAEQIQMEYLNSVFLNDVVKPGHDLVSLTR